MTNRAVLMPAARHQYECRKQSGPNEDKSAHTQQELHQKHIRASVRKDDDAQKLIATIYPSQPGRDALSLKLPRES